MKLLVSSPHRLFLVDSITHDVKVVEQHRQEYYGISWTKAGQLVLSHSGLNNAALLTFEDYAQSEKGRLSLDQKSVPDCLSQPHQLLCLPNHILTANTGRNCLTVFRQDDLYYRHYWFDRIHWDRLDSQTQRGSHFNSIYFKDERVYLLAHNNNQRSFVLELAWPSLEVIRRIDSTVEESHNIWLTDSLQMIVCNFKNASLDDISSGEVLWKSPERNVFPRGLASAQGLVFVGQSKITGRGGRASSHGGIWVLEKQSWQIIDFIPLPFSGNIHEIRVLDSADDCHHGHPFAGIIEGSDEATNKYLEHVEELAASGIRYGWQTHVGQVKWDGTKQFTIGPDLTITTIQEMRARNVRISALLTFEPHPIPTHIALVGRYSGPSDENMYLGMLIQEGSAYTAQIWKNVGGEWMQLASKPLDRGISTLTFELEDQELRLFADNALLIQITDSALTAPGEVGIRGLSGSVQNFNAVKL